MAYQLCECGRKKTWGNTACRRCLRIAKKVKPYNHYRRAKLPLDINKTIN